MADGFSVRTDAVAAGSGPMRSLGSDAQDTAAVAVGALEEMAEAAGHPGLTQALAGMTSTAGTMFEIAEMAFEQSAVRHVQTAQGYADADAGTIEAIDRAGVRGIW